jgi:hypothetical protein
MLTADEIPGYQAASAALLQVGGLLLTEDAALGFAAVALTAAGPFVKAETLADLADLLDEMGMPDAARVLDESSAAIRAYLRGEQR